MTNENTVKRTGINKSLATNLAAAVCIGVGFALPEPWSRPIQTMGLFALSGALTNWVAVHMLFEKVPGFYGSGVIPLHFEEFKTAIHRLMMRQFFNKENVERLFGGDSGAAPSIDFDALLAKADLDPAFDALTEAVKESSLGGMLSMFGGASALEPLRGPFAEKMRVAVKDVAASPEFNKELSRQLASGSVTDDILEKVSAIVTKRLDELTPQAVKEIIEEMIHEHLGWLVIWGGVFGGLIGLVASFLPI